MGRGKKVERDLFDARIAHALRAAGILRTSDVIRATGRSKATVSRALERLKGRGGAFLAGRDGRENLWADSADRARAFGEHGSRRRARRSAREAIRALLLDGRARTVREMAEELGFSYGALLVATHKMRTRHELAAAGHDPTPGGPTRWRLQDTGRREELLRLVGPDWRQRTDERIREALHDMLEGMAAEEDREEWDRKSFGVDGDRWTRVKIRVPPHADESVAGRRLDVLRGLRTAVDSLEQSVRKALADVTWGREELQEEDLPEGVQDLLRWIEATQRTVGQAVAEDYSLVADLERAISAVGLERLAVWVDMDPFTEELQRVGAFALVAYVLPGSPVSDPEAGTLLGRIRENRRGRLALEPVRPRDRDHGRDLVVLDPAAVVYAAVLPHPAERVVTAWEWIHLEDWMLGLAREHERRARL